MANAFIVALVYVAGLVGSGSGKTVKGYWKPINMIEVIAEFRHISLVGRELVRINKPLDIDTRPHHSIYLCRGWDGQRWIPGKLSTLTHWDSKNYCFVGIDKLHKLEISYENKDRIQILAIPPEYVSWIPLPANGQLPKMYVDAGDNAPICRVFSTETGLHVGIFIEATGECKYPYYDMKSLKATEPGNMEILCLNLYGSMFLKDSEITLPSYSSK